MISAQKTLNSTQAIMERYLRRNEMIACKINDLFLVNNIHKTAHKIMTKKRLEPTSQGTCQNQCFLKQTYNFIILLCGYIVNWLFQGDEQYIRRKTGTSIHLLLFFLLGRADYLVQKWRRTSAGIIFMHLPNKVQKECVPIITRLF